MDERKPKFTPGPWEVQDPLGPETLSIVEAGKPAHEWRFIAQIDAEGEAGGIPIRQAKANAWLIAAAPEMYDTLVVLRAALLEQGMAITASIIDAALKEIDGDTNE